MNSESDKFNHSALALLVIDVQMAFVHRDQQGADRSTPTAETNIQKMLDAFRRSDASVIHIHHHSEEPDSAFRPELPGSEVQPFAKPLDGESVYVKHVNSGFIGTTLEADLHRDGIRTLVMCGATANHCVETTTRMAGNLGFDTFYIADGVWAYSSTGPDGQRHSAEEVLSATLNSIHGEFATVVSTEEVLKMI